jgi:hypothetical protein
MKRFLAGLIAAAALMLATTEAAELRIGMIGLDTSHVTAFTELLNNSENKQHIPGAKVVAAFKGGSPDIPASADRIDKFTRELQDKYGVKLVSSIGELCEQVDAVLLESVDGRPHLEQVRPVLLAHKPVFIDKPMAGSLRDVIAIFKLAKKEGTPCFTSSAYRFYDSLVELKQTNVGEIKGAISYGPSSLEPHHPDFFWYGIHSIEALFTVLGPGCETVTRVSTPDTDVVTGIWKDGKVGTFRGLRNAVTPHQVILFGTGKVASQKGGGEYTPLLRQIVKFFQTGRPPVSMEESLEIYAFMEAADQSKQAGGCPIRLSEVILKSGGPL